jgi:hypothetical protein
MSFGRLHSRRDLLRLGAGALLSSIAPCATNAALSPSRARFQFVVVNDLHYRDKRCGPWFERVVDSIRAQRPRPVFVMLAGDLSEDGTREQLGPVREIFDPFLIPVRAIVGNHDCDVTGDFAGFKDVYGSSFNYRFEHADWQFLAFDSTQGRSVYRTRISTDTLSWLDRTLPSLSREKPLVLLTHFPLGRNWLRPLNANAVIERLHGFNLQAALGGHWHGITEHEEHGVHLSTNRCCSWWRDNHDGSPLKGYALCRIEGGRISHEFVPVS